MSGERILERARRFLGKRERLAPGQLVCGDLAGVRQVVVIPVLAEEKRLFTTLASLGRNHARERERTLVVCVVNNRADPSASPEQVADNQRVLGHLDALVHGRSPDTNPPIAPDLLRLASVDASSPGREIGPKMGVGEARRIGLDLGLSVLTKNGQDQGLLVSLDADTTVEAEYLSELSRHFSTTSSTAAVVAYAHSLPTDEGRRTAIVRYELFLRYHELALRSAGSPYAFPAIGSTMVARCDAYVAAGGMNRRQAGEDFYFLQELAKTGEVGRVDTTVVHPSARSSDRVPFGTGVTIGRHLAGESDGETAYHPESYWVLGEWLALVAGGLDLDARDLLHGAGELSPDLRGFLEHHRFEEVWPRLQENAPNQEGLHRQFHRWFDGFRTLKLIHHLRDQGLGLSRLCEAIHVVLERSGLDSPKIRWREISVDLDAQEQLLEHLRRCCAAR
jgi:hypothetical protein